MSKTQHPNTCVHGTSLDAALIDPAAAVQSMTLGEDIVIDGEPVSTGRAGTHRLAPRTGAAFLLRAGESLTVTDPEGEQVSDLFAVDASDTRHRLSSGRTIDYANRIYLREGDTLYSNRSEPMLELVDDTSGGHDFLLTPCSCEMFAKLYGITEPRPSCFGNLAKNMAHFGVEPDTIGTTLNIFMSVRPDARTGELTIGAPTSRAGDHATFQARTDLIVGLTACSAEKSNNGSFKPIEFAIA
ncbi:MAG: urea carboxylase-associated family protein [Planctomycetota bacterium]